MRGILKLSRHCEPCVAWRSNPQPIGIALLQGIASSLAMTRRNIVATIINTPLLCGGILILLYIHFLR